MAVRILHLEMGRHLYGGARQVLYLMRGLAGAGMEQCLACPPGSELGDAARAEGHDVREIPYAGDLDVGLAVRLRALVKATGTDVLHIHSRKGADTWGVLAAAGLDVAVLITRRVDNPDHPLLIRWKRRFADEFVAISEGVRRALVADGISQERVPVIHSAVDLERFRPGAPGTPDLCSRYGLPEGSLVVGMIAQLIPRKGHHHLFRALPPLLERFPTLRVLVFGQGPLRHDLEAHLRLKGLNGAVVFAGYEKSLDRALPQLDLVVHPALMEGLGVALLEAAASGVAIVASAVGGIPEVVRDGVNGLLVPAGDSGALREAMAGLLADPGARRTMGQAGRALMEREFSIEGMADAYGARYRDLLASRPLP